MDDKKGRGGNGKETYREIGKGGVEMEGDGGDGRGGGWGWVEMTRGMGGDKGRGGDGR